MQKKILCQSCGAENARYGKCEYCGSMIVPDLKDMEEGGYEVEGIYKVNYDERVLTQKYGQFEDETITCCKYCNNQNFLGICTYNETHDFIYESSLVFYHMHNKSDNYFIFYLVDSDGTKSTIHIGNRNYIIDYYLKEDMLLTLCEASSATIKCGNELVSAESVKAIILLAQVFYHTFCDSTKYMDAADRLIDYYEEKQDEAKFEQQIREIEWIREQKERDKQENIVIVKIVVTVLCVLSPFLIILIFILLNSTKSHSSILL